MEHTITFLLIHDPIDIGTPLDEYLHDLEAYSSYLETIIFLK